MKPFIDLLISIHEKLSKLNLSDWEEFLGIFNLVLGYNIQEQTKRIFDPEFEDDPEILFIDFVSGYIGMSKSDIRKLIKNNGIKVNNKIPSPVLKVKDIPWIELEEHRIAIVKIGKNKFDFIIM
jgi:tyrosyl-tRNA synthetase